jgi:N-acetylneuraminic acid mutarotase
MYRSWQRAQLAAAALTLVSFGLTGCRDESSPTGIDPSDGGSESEAIPSSGDLRTGYIRGRDGTPVKIRFRVRGEFAIFQGDIVLGPVGQVATSPEQLQTSPPHVPGGPSFGVVIDGSAYRWPGGVVPYYIDPALPNKARVTDAIAKVEASTAGVDLVPWSSGHADYVYFSDADGGACSSRVGRQGGGQYISLGQYCDAGSAMHEILHALGMQHEQGRCDRDTYVEILSENIKPDEVDNFDRYCNLNTDLFAYAEGSLMHYGPTAFSKNGLPTIRSKRGLDNLMGQRDHMGSTDIATINKLYPGTSSAWVARSSMPTARKQLATAVLNGALFAIGGTSSTPTANLTKVESYNPSTNSWTTRASLPSGRGRTGGAAVINGVLYVAGGYGAGTTGLTKTLYAYNGSSNTWSSKATMPSAGGCGGAGAINGLLYVIIGCDANTTATSGSKGILLRYNPATNTWSAKPAAPSAHRLPGVAALGGKLYVVGGKNSIGVVTNELHVYNPATNSWSTKAGMPSARYNLTAYAVGSQLYAVGGNNGADAFTNTVYIYNPSTNTWKTGPSMPTARAGLTAGAINGALYVLGGYTSTATALATNEKLTP